MVKGSKQLMVHGSGILKTAKLVMEVFWVNSNYQNYKYLFIGDKK